MREAFTDIVHGRPLNMKMSLNHLIDELVVALGISPEAAARHLGERGPDAVGDPVVLPQPDVLYEKEETLLHLSGHSWQQTQIIWQQTDLHGEEEGVGHAAVVAARVVAAPLVRVRMGTCGGRKGTASLRCPI